ncbi:hypothetical protein CsSME_00001661 [Camellia sinensis var. sinensis]
MSSSTSICLKSLIPLDIRANSCRSHLGISTLKTRETKLSTVSCTRLHNSQITTPTTTSNQQQQLNLSVLRFTLGIPGLDESYLPRWIGYAFGALLLLNHFVGSDSTTATPAQFRSEALGLSLAGFSIVLPYLGKFLKSLEFCSFDATCWEIIDLIQGMVKILQIGDEQPSNQQKILLINQKRNEDEASSYKKKMNGRNI